MFYAGFTQFFFFKTNILFKNIVTVYQLDHKKIITFAVINSFM